MKTKVVGITGTIASGKSLVGRLLSEAGVPVLDTDHICHEVEANDREVRKALLERFGPQVFENGGALNRKKLGRIVFDNPEALRQLNDIVHPAIRAELQRQVAELSGVPLVAVLVPLLFEAGVEKQYDEIWTVTAADAVVRTRLKLRDGISDEDADKRLGAQFSQQEKIARSNRVIDNSGTIDDTRLQVWRILEEQAKK
jgi:dephospho-CoA kinase